MANSFWEQMGFQVNDYRSDTEKQAEKDAARPLAAELERYANDVVNAFARGDNTKVRAIGEKLNDNKKQLQVFHRAAAIGASRGVHITSRAMERLWEGCGGWQV